MSNRKDLNDLMSHHTGNRVVEEEAPSLIPVEPIGLDDANMPVDFEIPELPSGQVCAMVLVYVILSLLPRL